MTDSKVVNGGNLSIVVLTKNRHRLLKRTLDFLSDQSNVYRVIVLDGSDKNVDFPLPQFVDYRKSRENDQLERLFEALATIKDPYVLVIGDDDFVNLETIPRICNILDERKEYAAVDGREIRVCCDENGVSDAIFHDQNPISNPSDLKRINSHCSKYWPTFYAIHRTEVLRRSMEFVHTISDIEILYRELGASMMTIAQGGYFSIEEPYMVRQILHSQSVRAIWWDDIVSGPNFEERNERFLTRFTDFARSIGIILEVQDVRAAFDQYLEPFKNRDFRSVVKARLEKVGLGKLLVVYRKLKGKRGDHEISATPPQHMNYLESPFYKAVAENLSQWPTGKP